MRRTSLLGLWVAVPVLLIAAEGVAQALWAQEAFEKAFYQFVSSDHYTPVPGVPAPLKALAASQRRAAVEALGARAKVYFASEAFKKSWIQGHGGHYDDPGAAKAQAKNKDLERQAQASVDKSLADMEQMIPMMPPAVQEQMRAELAKAKAQKAKEQAKRSARKEDQPASGEAVKVPDAKVALRGALQRFLRASEGVDFEAALTHGEQRATFSNPAYEAKPEAWKACFRAGRAATEAARAYAKAWLAELG